MRRLFCAAIALLPLSCHQRSVESRYSSPAGVVTFSAPANWSKENLEGGVLLLMAPNAEAGWQANVSFESRRDLDRRDLPQMLQALIPNIQRAKTNVEIVESGVRDHPAGFRYGFILYRHSNQGVALLDREIVIPLGRDGVLFVLTSTAQAVASKYEPIFASLVDSIRLRR